MNLNKISRFTRSLCFLALGLAASLSLAAEPKRIVLVAGKASHGPGDHEFNAGIQLIKKCLDKVPGVVATQHLNGWPTDPAAFDKADAVIFYMDGGAGHPMIQQDHLKILGELAKKGVGIGAMHYGVEVPKDKGGAEFLEWIGGYYESGWSTNPHWTADFKTLPKHPITQGVKPFAIQDEWYYNIRFRPDMKGVTPLLVGNPSEETRQGKSSSPRGPYPHIVAAKGRDEVLSWVVERPDGGRGFGFTGGHFHRNWGHDDFRKFVLNAMLWTAKAPVPKDGVSSDVTLEELNQNLDPKSGPKPRINKPNAGIGPEGRGFGREAAIKDLEKMTVADGLEVTVFASEPQLRNPANMDIDHKGRVWVTEGVNYRSSFQSWGTLRPEGDRIVILEDTNGDGKADLEKVFYQGKEINTALGICVLGNQVLVSCSPNVFLFTDTDGDDKADKKETFFTGFAGVDHDHGVHAFVFGPDGKLYFNFGDQGKKVLRADGTPVTDLAGNVVAETGKPYRKGMVFRCNPDGSQFETLGWNFRNNYEVAVDSFGTLWQSDNDDDGNQGVRINYVMEFGNYGYTDEMTGAGWTTKRTNWEEDVPRRHWYQNDPGVIPNLLQTGAGSPTGIAIYEGSLLPSLFRGQMVHCEPGQNVVRAYPVTNDGAGYKATTVNILKSSDSWFRPSDVCVAPDGSLLIADWNDAGVGGHNMADRSVESMRGRIYRVAPKGSKYTVPKLNLKNADDLAAALKSPNHETRYIAWMKLHGMGNKAEKALVKLWKSDDQRIRARALHLLGRSGSADKYLKAALKDSNPDIRITALRIQRDAASEAKAAINKTGSGTDVGIRLTTSDKVAGTPAGKNLKSNQVMIGPDLMATLHQLVKDPSPQVRREVAIALRHNPSPMAPALWAELAKQYDGKDRWYLEALGLAADRQEDAFLNAWLAQVGAGWNSPAGRDILWRSRASVTPDYLVKILQDKTTPEKEKARYLRSLDFLKGPQKEKALIDLLSTN